MLKQEFTAVLKKSIAKYCQVEEEFIFFESELQALMQQNPLSLNMVLMDLHEYTRQPIKGTSLATFTDYVYIRDIYAHFGFIEQKG